MNAAYTAADRSSGTMTTDDKAHHQIENELHMQPTDHGTEPHSRPHTFYSNAQDGRQHSRIDGFMISNNLQIDHKPTTRVLPATDDSDHLPILSEIPLGAISFVPPGPELPMPDRIAKLKVPPSMRETIHRLFVPMWMTGTTPDSWKESNTILYYS